MQRLDRTRRLVAGQLTRISLAAKLLVAALMVILVLSLVLVAALAGRPAMVPLRIRTEAQQAALAHLDAAGIPYEVRGGEVLVPAERQHAILGQLSDRDVIRGDQIDFDRLIESDSPFRSRDQDDKRWLVAKMNVLSRMIGGFRGIEQATVVIDQSPRGTALGSARVPPTASVHVISTGELGQEQVEAIAHLVAGAQAGLGPENVRVVDGRSGQSYRTRSAADVAGGGYLEIKQKHERLVLAKLQELLGYIPGVRIAVNAMVDNTIVQRQTQRIEEARSAPTQELRENDQWIEQFPGGEPGMRTNIPLDVSRAGGGVRQRTHELEDTRSENRFPTALDVVQDPRGYPLKVNATIGVPRSYFVGTYRQDRNDPLAVPDDAALAAVVDQESARIRRAVEPLVDTVAMENATLGTVVVDVIPDALAAPGAAPPEAAAPSAPAGATLVLLDPGLWRNLGLGGLALLALLLMFFMVRRAGARGPLPTAAEMTGAPPPLPADGEGVLGEAEESAVALEGVELDEPTLRRQQMLDQIATMVQDSPDEVSNLLRRWISVAKP